DGATQAVDEMSELPLEPAFEGGVTKARDDGAASNEAHLLDDKQLPHRSVGADGITVLHPVDLDAVPGQDLGILVVGPGYLVKIQLAAESQQEEIFVLREKILCLPMNWPAQSDFAQTTDAHRAPLAAPHRFKFIQIAGARDFQEIRRLTRPII